MLFMNGNYSSLNSENVINKFHFCFSSVVSEQPNITDIRQENSTTFNISWSLFDVETDKDHFNSWNYDGYHIAISPMFPALTPDTPNSQIFLAKKNQSSFVTPRLDKFSLYVLNLAVVNKIGIGNNNTKCIVTAEDGRNFIQLFSVFFESGNQKFCEYRIKEHNVITFGHSLKMFSQASRFY